MKKNSRKTITLCSSASFYKQVLEIAADLKKLGFKVKIPYTANIMKKTGNFDADFYKTWFRNEKDYSKKTILMKRHFDKVASSDAILVLNHEKNGVAGYIGGNGLMEMGLAFHYKKLIFVYNPISEGLDIKEEIYGLNPIFINGDLNLVSKRLKSS
jgi:hypothetical protein